MQGIIIVQEEANRHQNPHLDPKKHTTLRPTGTERETHMPPPAKGHRPARGRPNTEANGHQRRSCIKDMRLSIHPAVWHEGINHFSVFRAGTAFPADMRLKLSAVEILPRPAIEAHRIKCCVCIVCNPLKPQ